MIYQWFQRAAELINKDTGEANESPKLIVVIRIITLSMLLYVIVNSIIYIHISNIFAIVILFAFFIDFLFRKADSN